MTQRLFSYHGYRVVSGLPLASGAIRPDKVPGVAAAVLVYRPCSYQVGAEMLTRYIDLGFSLSKLGEEAVVPLETLLSGHLGGC